jgi:type I restriction enzyme S subunit
MHLENFNAGAGVPTLNQNHLHKLKISIPPLPIQKKIAAVLSAYDDLIENNNRRIAILEKMAEEIYREWA